MNKHIENIIGILGEIPSLDSDIEARKYLNRVVSSGEFKPSYSFIHEEIDSFDSVAITMPKESIGETCLEVVEFGEIISKPIFKLHAYLHEDYFEWVNFFVCVSDDGEDYVVGNFEDVVYFSSKSFYNKLTEQYLVEVWDYHDI